MSIPAENDPAVTAGSTVGISACRWGVVRPVCRNGQMVGLLPFERDCGPSPNIAAIAGLLRDRNRILYPMMREGWLKDGPESRSHRGEERFVRVSWDEALHAVAGELDRMYGNFGPSSVYGSSYGWKSSGSVNDARGCLYRLLNFMGGFTASRNTYSSAASSTILPYVIGSANPRCTAWDNVIAHSERVVFWGCNPLVTNDVDWFTTLHQSRAYLGALKEKGTMTWSVNPILDDTADFLGSRWLAVNPGSDTAMMAAMIHELEATGKTDRDFLARYTSGWEKVRAWVLGNEDGLSKTPEWAEGICGIPAATIRQFVHDIQEHRTMLMIGWGIQRIDHGEQYHWMLVTLAAALGQIGLPGGGFGTGYHYSGGGVPQAEGPFLASIPTKVRPLRPVLPWTGSRMLHVAALTDALENPGISRDFDGGRETYPEFRMIFWSGGNPFAHHPDTLRLERAWKKPETVVVTDIVWTATARHADIVLPACSFLERDDICFIGGSSHDGITAMKKAVEPLGESRPDYRIYSGLAEMLGFGEQYTEGLNESGWIRRLYEEAAARGLESGTRLPLFDEFWTKGYILYDVPQQAREYVSFADFRRDPAAHPLNTESGLIQLYSPRIESYGYDDCRGHAMHFEPAEGTATATKEYPLSLMAPKSRWRLHSQLDSVNGSTRGKSGGHEPVWINNADAERRNIRNGDVVIVRSRRGACLAGAVVTGRIKPGVIAIHHGSWFNPQQDAEQETRVDIGGNSNTLTIDKPTSKLARGNIASTGNVEVMKWNAAASTGQPPPVVPAAANLPA